VLYKNKLPNNPNQFDYGEYLSKNKSMPSYTLTWIRSALVPYLKRHLVLCRAITNNDYSKLREEQFPQKRVKCSRSFNFGAKQDLSPDILQDYQYGAIHILSVSGLHVGFLLLFLTFILKPIPNTQKALS
jgi:competence protein ComEC